MISVLPSVIFLVSQETAYRRANNIFLEGTLPPASIICGNFAYIHIPDCDFPELPVTRAKGDQPESIYFVRSGPGKYHYQNRIHLYAPGIFSHNKWKTM